MLRATSDAVRELNGDDAATTVAKIRAVFDSEVADPADAPTGTLKPEIAGSAAPITHTAAAVR